MTATVIRNSRMTDEWIREIVRMNPIQAVLATDGQPTGNFLTGPVRLSFPNLFKVHKPMANNGQTPQGEGKYDTVGLMTPFHDLALLYAEYYRACAEYWPDKRGQDGQYYGLEPSFKDQGAKGNYEGYTPGCVFITAKSQYKPAVVDMNMNPIVDEAQVYPGVWAILSVNSYKYGAQFPKKGIGWGLQSVMIIGNDTNVGGGGAADPRSQFGGVNVAPPTAIPTGGFGAPPPPGQPWGHTNAQFLTPHHPGAAPPVPAYAPPPPYAPPQPAYAAPAQASKRCMVCEDTMPAYAAVCTSCGSAI